MAKVSQKKNSLSFKGGTPFTIGDKKYYKLGKEWRMVFDEERIRKTPSGNQEFIVIPPKEMKTLIDHVNLNFTSGKQLLKDALKAEEEKKNRETEGRKDIENAYNSFKKKRADEINRPTAIVPYKRELPAVRVGGRSLPMVIDEKSGLPFVLRGEERLPMVRDTNTNAVKVLDKKGTEIATLPKDTSLKVINYAERLPAARDANTGVMKALGKNEISTLAKNTAIVPYRRELPAVRVGGRNLPMVIDEKSGLPFVLRGEERLPLVRDADTNVVKVLDSKGTAIATLPTDTALQIISQKKPVLDYQMTRAWLEGAEMPVMPKKGLIERALERELPERKSPPKQEDNMNDEQTLGKKYSKRFPVKELAESSKEESYAKKEAENWPMKSMLEKEEKKDSAKKKSGGGKGGFSGALSGMDPEMLKKVTILVLAVIVLSAVAALFR